jgi:hypothetical protein
MDWMIERNLLERAQVPLMESMQRGGIIGQANLVHVVTESESPWWMGPYGFLLEDIKSLPYQPCKGMLGFFEPR